MADPELNEMGKTPEERDAAMREPYPIPADSAAFERHRTDVDERLRQAPPAHDEQVERIEAPILPDLTDLLGARIMHESETSEAVSTIAGRVLSRGNPLERGSWLYGDILKITGAKPRDLDNLEAIHELLKPWMEDVMACAASALAQAPEHG
jgi:hypothetical protein